MVSSYKVDLERRRFLSTSTLIVGGIGAGFAAIPFLQSWTPSIKARALGSPVEVDISKMEYGQQLTVPWRGKPVFIIKRTSENLKEIEQLNSLVADPDSMYSEQPNYAKNIYRSIQQEFLVMIGICTHLGCVPVYKPEHGSIDPKWIGGFFCPCHGSKYDLAGRVYKNMPAPKNMPIPSYYFVNEAIIKIGEDQG